MTPHFIRCLYFLGQTIMEQRNMVTSIKYLTFGDGF